MKKINISAADKINDAKSLVDVSKTYKQKFQIEGITLKDRLDRSNRNLINIYSKNPVRSSLEQSVELSSAVKFLPKDSIVKRNFTLLVLVVCLLGISVLLNSFFASKVDPLLVSVTSKPVVIVSKSVGFIKELFFDVFQKPYVVTVGEYGNLAIAKDEAEKLLPRFKQINIKELESGIYVFEIERLSSKKNSYKLANILRKDDLQDVHVRYLP